MGLDSRQFTKEDLDFIQHCREVHPSKDTTSKPAITHRKTRRYKQGMDMFRCVMPDGHETSDLTGLRFGQLTAFRYAGTRHGHPQWMCSCSCGIICRFDADQLTNGTITHCNLHPGSGLHILEPAAEEDIHAMHSAGETVEALARYWETPVQVVQDCVDNKYPPAPGSVPNRDSLPDRAAQWLISRRGQAQEMPWCIWLGDHQLMQAMDSDEDNALVGMCSRRGLELFWISGILMDEEGDDYPIMELRERYRRIPTGLTVMSDTIQYRLDHPVRTGHRRQYHPHESYQQPAFII